MKFGRAVNTVLKKFGLRITRGTATGIGMSLSLLGLRDRGFQPKTVLDIGAAYGDWTKECLKVYPNSKFLLLEPLAEYNNALNKMVYQHSNVRFINAVAGAVSGQVEMHVQKDLVGSSLLDDKDKSYSGSMRSISMVSIDDLLNKGELEPPELVKIDVQGFELEVLKGGGSLFNSAEVFILEVSLYEFCHGMPIAQDIIAYMAKKGFVLYDIATIIRRPLDDALAQMDVVFVRETSRLRASQLWS